MIIGALMAVMMAYLVLTEPEEGIGGRHTQRQQQAEPPPHPPPMGPGSQCSDFTPCPSGLDCKFDEDLDMSVCKSMMEQ